MVNFSCSFSFSAPLVMSLARPLMRASCFLVPSLLFFAGRFYRKVREGRFRAFLHVFSIYIGSAALTQYLHRISPL